MLRYNLQHAPSVPHLWGTWGELINFDYRGKISVRESPI